MPTTITGVDYLPNLLHRGKVRDIYAFSAEHLLFITTDRLSAFDVVLPSAIPDKGLVLNRISAFWFNETAHIVPNHFVALGDGDNIPPEFEVHPLLNTMDAPARGRSMIVRKAQRIDVECVVRGYLTGSAYAEYSKSGTVHGQALPSGLRDGDQLPEPLFTPTTKADEGHDEPMSMEEVSALVGEDVANRLRDATIKLYEYARTFARKRGIIIADTKLEFGWIDGELTLIDELFTPDSSRFWDLGSYRPGQSMPNFDKQFVRDWLVRSGWSKEPPAPALPASIIKQTRQRYVEAYHHLTGQRLEPSLIRKLLSL
ncbi:MAG: phosphoribosylaminoimidazole-succinocarboxamide synthase [Chloroflexi bacterium]|nr:MAG: phosphoribosylaminoimidazole-succinocarboxamide synthase [Chloroflexota bacterium]